MQCIVCALQCRINTSTERGSGNRKPLAHPGEFRTFCLKVCLAFLTAFPVSSPLQPAPLRLKQMIDSDCSTAELLIPIA